MQTTINLPEKPKIIKEEGNLASFEIKSCFPGYGMTLGNAFRRILLSSLPGAAITSVKINGAEHEFSTLPGVFEDVVEIILNLKQIKFKMFTDEPIKIILKAKGEGKVTAADIKTSSEVEIANKDLHIATLTDKSAVLEMEMQVEKGLGYASIEQREKNKLGIGNIAVDAIFSPIRKISYKVENMRVGQMTNYNKLILDIETDGSISPKEALKKASAILVEQFNVFAEIEEIKSREEEKEEKKSEKIKEEKIEKKTERRIEEDFLKKGIDELKLSTRTINVLKENKIKNAGQLVKKNEEKVKNLEGMGDKGVKEIKRALGNLGLTLKE
jgi:DNA-directed RNA polymerase subunit alpha